MPICVHSALKKRFAENLLEAAAVDDGRASMRRIVIFKWRFGAKKKRKKAKRRAKQSSADIVSTYIYIYISDARRSV